MITLSAFISPFSCLWITALAPVLRDWWQCIWERFHCSPGTLCMWLSFVYSERWKSGRPLLFSSQCPCLWKSLVLGSTLTVSSHWCTGKLCYCGPLFQLRRGWGVGLLYLWTWMTHFLIISFLKQAFQRTLILQCSDSSKNKQNNTPNKQAFPSQKKPNARKLVVLSLKIDVSQEKLYILVF